MPGDVVPDRAARLTSSELAALAGTTAEPVARLTAAGVLVPEADGSYHPGDAHVVRLLEAFEAAGVPLDALAAAAASGRIDFTGYHQLHGDTGRPSPESYGELRNRLGPGDDDLPALFAAFGLAEPRADAHLPADEAAVLEEWLGLVRGVDDPALTSRLSRLFAEAARRTTSAALEIYEEAAARIGPDPATIPTEAYEALLVRWADLARGLPALAAWLTERHLRQAIDAFSVETTERILAADGYVPEREAVPPAVAFVDLTGFTRRTQEGGDETAASLSLRLGDVARDAVRGRRGRLVKLLGDGALLLFPDAVSAVDATADLLDALPAAELPGGHAGIASGPVIERDGDVFGRTVNLAARLSDVAPDGAIYLTSATADAIAAAPFDVRLVGEADLHGIGPTRLYRLDR